MPASPLQPFFRQRGWKSFPFQKETWAAYAAGKSGLLHAPTGLGKTLAVWGGPIIEHLSLPKSKINNRQSTIVNPKIPAI